ncbi:hypothetical protein PQX77_020138 [Marasmius sp. AFHP31]|nr:hypothetical protein PQX77_020138 [Marasmius sp. AFHP31]
MKPLPLVALLISSLPLVSRGEFSPTPLWLDWNVTQPLQDRLSTAYSALVQGPLHVTDLGSPANQHPLDYIGYPQFYAAAANFELATRDNNTEFRELALQYFQNTNNRNKMVVMIDIIEDAYAAIRLYKAFNDMIFLSIAQKQWGLAYEFTVSQNTTFPNGTMATKTFPVFLDCRDPYGNGTIEGGTFWLANLYDQSVCAYNSALYSLLSARLAETEPSNPTYIQVAMLSLDFALREVALFNYSTKSTYGRSSLLGPEGCQNISINSGNPGASLVGATIEAMSVMYSVTGDTDVGERLQHTIASTLHQLGDPEGPRAQNFGSNGVFLNRDYADALADQNDGKFLELGDMYLLRGLAESYRRGSGALSASLRDEIKVVLGIHYNAIRDLATAGDNIYSRDWAGPRPTQVTFELYNQAAAAQILIDGIDLFNDSDIAPLTRSTPSKPSTALIAGATIGSVASLLLMIIAIYYLFRQRKKRSSGSNPSRVVEPFVATPYDEGKTFPRKHPVPDSQARLEPLRQPTSPPSEATGSSRERPGVHDPPNIRPDASLSHTEGGEVELAPTFPDMVRVVYQRLWQHNELESPPDYHSDSGEPPERFPMHRGSASPTSARI